MLEQGTVLGSTGIIADMSRAGALASLWLGTVSKWLFPSSAQGYVPVTWQREIYAPFTTVICNVREAHVICHVWFKAIAMISAMCRDGGPQAM